MTENKPTTDDTVLEFYSHVSAFQVLSKKTEAYLATLCAMKRCMSGVNNAMLLFSSPDWPQINQFKAILKDIDDLWDLLEQDVRKLESGFQDFTDRFYIVLNSRVKLEEKAEQYRIFKEESKKRLKNKALSTADKDEISKVSDQKQRELMEHRIQLDDDVEELCKSQRNYLVDHFNRFFQIHDDFCKDFEKINAEVSEVLNGFLPKGMSSSSQ